VAGKAIKAVYQHLGGEARGHDLDGLLQGLATRVRIPKALFPQVAELEKHYIATRYPNAHVQGPPFRHYTQGEARRAVRYADAVLRFCRGHMA
jgi:HEPN domain-containing protein